MGFIPIRISYLKLYNYTEYDQQNFITDTKQIL